MPGTLGNFLLQMFEQGEARKEQAKQDASKTTVLRKALSLYDEPNKDRYTTMGKDELEGTMLELTMKKAKQAEQLQAEQVNQLKLQNEAQSALARVMPAAMAHNRMNTQVPFASRPVNIEDVIAGLTQNRRAVNAPNIDNVLRLMETQQEGPLATTFDEDPETGYRFAARGKQFMPSGVNPKVSAAVIPLQTEAGEVLGYGTPTRSGVQQIKTPAGVTDKDRFNALQSEKRALIAAKSKSILKESLSGYDAQIAAVDAELEKLNPTAKASAPKEVALTMPEVGEVRKGYKFKGGDPSKKENWIKQ